MRSNKIHLYIGVGILGLLVLAALIFMIWKGISVDINMDTQMQKPSTANLLGTDELGRDLLSCIIYGLGISLAAGLSVVLISLFIGGLLGMIAGFGGGIMDTVIMRLVDIMMAFPGILLAIALAAFLNRGVWTLLLVLIITGWAEYARLIRGEVLRIKEKEFILAARLYNASFFRILFHYILPLILPLLLVRASLGAASVILAESSLNFLGIGLDPETPSLGQMVDAGRAHLFDAPVQMIAPGITLFLLVLAFTFIGEGLRKRQI